MKKSLILLGMLSIGYAYAQEGNVGINTENPKATLDIVPEVGNLTKNTNEGIIAPRLTKERIAGIADANLVEGTLVYATDTTYTGTNTKVSKITEKGYYYYNGTEWVKVQYKDTNDAEWVRDSNSGVDKIYMKNVLTNDEISYRRDSGRYVMNLGNLNATEAGESSLSETPNSILIRSSKLPATLKSGSTFNFNSTTSLINQEHVAKDAPTWGKNYAGNQFRILTDGVTSNMGALHGIVVNATSKNSVGTQYGTVSTSSLEGSSSTTTNNIGLASTGEVGNTANTTNNYGAFIQSFTRAGGKATNLIGIESRVFNLNSDANKSITAMTGINNSLTSMNAVSGQYPAIKIGNLHGINSSVVNNPNTTTTVVRNLNLSNGYSTNSITDYGRGIDVGATIQQGSTIKEFSSIYTNVYSAGAATIDKFFIFRFSNTLNANTTPKEMYGIYLDDIKNGQDTKNYALYTNAGKIRVGDLADASATADRVVTVDADGVLKVGTSTTAPTVFKWVEDTSNSSVKLAVTSAGVERTDNPVSITDTGMVKATSFQGSNGATIFPDYVFQKYYDGVSDIKADYTFKSLSQVEDFVKVNGHLPGYKSAAEIKNQGYIDLMETQLTNVEKIEELYLHSIEQEKAIKAKDAKIQELEARLEKLEKLLK